MRCKYQWAAFLMALWGEYGVALEAPLLTSRDLLEELFIDPKGYLNLKINDHLVRATYIEEPILKNWLLEGLGDTRRVAIDYIKNIYNQHSPVIPLFIDVLNDRGIMIKVDKNNRGKKRFFKELDEGHEGMWAVKYRYQIPFLNSHEFEDGTGVYPPVNQTFFMIYAIVQEADIVFPDSFEEREIIPAPSCGTYPGTKATIAKDLPLPLPKSLIKLLPSLTEVHEIKLYRNNIWLFRKGRPVTFFTK